MDFGGMNPSCFLNFVLYAILGRTSMADFLMTRHASEVLSISKLMWQRYPQQVHPLWRGLLLEPEEVSPTLTVEHLPALKFLSFSERHSIAEEFASRKSLMSSFVVHCRPRVQGWMVHYQYDPSEVIFHHGWKEVIPWAQLARMHPHIAPHCDQFLSALHRQQEVILLPPKAPLKVMPYRE